MWQDFLFPKTCLSCGRLGAYICLTCREKLVYMETDRCLYCSRKSQLGMTHSLCKKRNGIDGILSVYHYNDILRRIIKNIKYRLVTDAFKELFLSIDPNHIVRFQKITTIYKDAWLQPIPLHSSRLKMRGFNQSEQIAHFFQSFLPYIISDCLRRLKNTSPQAQIKDKEERLNNIKGAFSIPFSDYQRRPVVLVDDVVTSGSTVKEAAQVLKEAGIPTVFVLSLARG